MAKVVIEDQLVWSFQYSLIKSWQMIRRKHVSKDVFDQIQYKLKSFRVMTIANLETLLCNEGVPVNSTVRTRSIFYDTARSDVSLFWLCNTTSLTDSERSFGRNLSGKRFNSDGGSGKLQICSMSTINSKQLSAPNRSLWRKSSLKINWFEAFNIPC
jgi:hypothetical protein